MKVLQLAYRLPFPSTDGGALGLLRIMEGYLNSGNDVTILAIRTPKHWVSDQEIKDFFSSYQNVQWIIVDVPTRPTIGGAILSLFSSSSYHATRLFNRQLLEKVRSVLFEKSFDLIHLDGPFWLPFINLIREKSNAKVVFRAHNVEHIIWKRLAEEARNPLKKWYLNRQWPKIKNEELAVAQKVDWILPISKVDSNWFAQHVNTPQHLLEAGLPLQKYQAVSFSDPFKWCFLASLEWMPNVIGLEYFLQNIWPLVHKEFPNVTLSIAGRRMPDSWKKREIKGVQFIGEIASVPDFFSKHGVLIVPLWSGSGVRIKIIEALAMGMPCLSTSVGAEGLDLASGVHFLEANNVDEWLDGAKKITNNPLLLSEFSKNGREFVFQHFDNRIIFEKWMQTLNFPF